VAAQPDGRTRLYLARDHRPLPGAPLNHAQDRRHIRGSILQYGGSDTAESLRKFTAVRDELMKRAAGNTGLEFNVYLEGNKLRTRFMQFAIESGATPPSLVSDAQQLLYGKTLIDLAVMRSTRDQTKAILTDKRLKVPPDLLRAWDEACRQIAILGAPFARPSPVQRVAWLDEQETITCTSEFAGDPHSHHHRQEAGVSTSARSLEEGGSAGLRTGGRRRDCRRERAQAHLHAVPHHGKDGGPALHLRPHQASAHVGGPHRQFRDARGTGHR
jgi:hypothetical protein